MSTASNTADEPTVPKFKPPFQTAFFWFTQMVSNGWRRFHLNSPHSSLYFLYSLLCNCFFEVDESKPNTAPTK